MTDKDVKRPVTNGEHDKNDFYNLDERVGHIGSKTGKWDNGLYVTAFMKTVPVQFLVDSGSTLTLISYNLFMKMCTDKELKLQKSDCQIKDANGKNLKTYGTAQMKILFCDKIFEHNVLICDILPEGILGQDFLLKYVLKIDYKKLCLCLETMKIPCWIGGEAEMVCLVQARETIQIPPESQVFIPVNIPKIECLSRFGVLEPSVDLFETCEITLTPGIIDTQAPEKIISVLNCGDQNVTIYPNMKLGTCESLYEQEPIKQEMCARINVSQKTDKPLGIPEHLQDLYLRSSTKLIESEKNKLTELLIKYQDAFSKSATDIGFTDLVQHKINTGTALPIRQPIRRLPFGKRETEKEEANKMLTMGVIEPSSSP